MTDLCERRIFETFLLLTVTFFVKKDNRIEGNNRKSSGHFPLIWYSNVGYNSLPWLTEYVVDWVGHHVVQEDEHLSKGQNNVHHNHPENHKNASLTNNDKGWST